MKEEGHSPPRGGEEALIVRVNPKDIVWLDHIMEGYEYLGAVTTLDAKAGKVMIRVTPDTRPVVLEILQHFPKEIEIIAEANEAVE